MLIDLWADTGDQFFGVGDFYVFEHPAGWRWCHKDLVHTGITSTCPTVFEALEAAHAASERMLSDKLDAMAANGGAS